MTGTFPMPPAGMFTDQRDFVEFGLVLGLMHPESADGVRVVAWDGEVLRHLTSGAARKYADDLVSEGHGKLLAHVINALRGLANEADRRNSPNFAVCVGAAAKMMAKLTETSPVEGRA